MTLLVIQHPVKDFDAWQKAFASDPAGRAKNGVTRHAIYRPLDNHNYVVVTLEFSTRERAQAFLDLPTMRQAWKGFLGVNVDAPLGTSYLHSPLGLEQFQARILEQVEAIGY